MKVLKEIVESVNMYTIMLEKDPQGAKAYCKEYLKDIDILETVTEAYSEETLKKFQKWTRFGKKAFDSKDSNFLFRLIRNVKISVVNYYLSKYSYELSLIDNLEEQFPKIKTRLTQFECLS